MAHPESYLVFTKLDTPNRKTGIWQVDNTSGTPLGRISWWSPWRCYVFLPKMNTAFNPACLSDIGEFCTEQTRLHREALKHVGGHSEERT